MTLIRRLAHLSPLRIGIVTFAATTSLALPTTDRSQGVQEPPGITRSDVVRRDLEVPGREVIQVRVDFAPGAAFGRHSHPGAEVAFVLEGAVEYQLDGQQPVPLKTGEALFIPAGAIHSARNVGTGKAAELATYIVEKGKPLVVQAKVP